MKRHQQLLLLSALCSFTVALFQIMIGFSPTLSLYFGAPPALAQNLYGLIFVSGLIGGILVIFGLYALAGAGYLRRLPWLKPALGLISAIFCLRGLLVIPEFLVVIGAIQSPIPVAPRFVGFSLVSLLIGILFLLGTIAGWQHLPSKSLPDDFGAESK